MPDLPRLLYIGEVPIENTFHGSALLFRLLSGYPPSKLHIAECLLTSEIGTRLHGPRYTNHLQTVGRAARTRFGDILRQVLTHLASADFLRIDLKGVWLPEAVLTVAHGVGWILAANFSKKMGLPLHLIVHDDPTLSVRSVEGRSVIHGKFAEVYKGAATRFCVSPGMAEFYERRYRIPGTVLYPSRARNTPVLPPKQLQHRKGERGLTIGYAGTLSQKGYLNSLVQLSHSIGKIDAKLLIIGPVRRAELLAAEMDMERVVLQDPLPPDELVVRLHDVADIVLLPSSFRTEDALAMQTLFPSKVVDYFASGVPCLVWANVDSSIARWVLSEPGTAELVTVPEVEQVISKIMEMKSSPERMLAMARQAATIGTKYFSLEAAEDTFLSTILKS